MINSIDVSLAFKVTHVVHLRVLAACSNQQQQAGAKRQDVPKSLARAKIGSGEFRELSRSINSGAVYLYQIMFLSPEFSKLM